MATKLNNMHLEKIIINSKNYKVLDVYIVLTHISIETKNNKFLIQTYTNKKSDIVNQVKKYITASYKTIYNNIDELIRLDILSYSQELSAWMLNDMETMIESKTADNVEKWNKLKGYTKIRKFFLTNEFNKMKYAEKRCLVYMAYLADSKAGKNNYDNYILNLAKNNSSWKKILKTKSKYYAKDIIDKMLDKNPSLFIDNSQELRDKDLAPNNIKNYKYSIECQQIKNTENDNTQYELIKKYNNKELTLLLNKIEFANINLSKTKQMHIIRSISNIKEWHLKERILQLIVNKYIAIQIHKTRKDIKSIPAYMTALVKSVINEYNEFKLHIANLKKNEQAIEYADKINNEENNKKMDYSIANLIRNFELA